MAEAVVRSLVRLKGLEPESVEEATEVAKSHGVEVSAEDDGQLMLDFRAGTIAEVLAKHVSVLEDANLPDEGPTVSMKPLTYVFVNGELRPIEVPIDAIIEEPETGPRGLGLVVQSLTAADPMTPKDFVDLVRAATGGDGSGKPDRSGDPGSPTKPAASNGAKTRASAKGKKDDDEKKADHAEKGKGAGDEKGEKKDDETNEDTETSPAPLEHHWTSLAQNLWGVLEGDEKKSLSKKYFQGLVEADLLKERAEIYQTAAEVVLLDRIDEERRGGDRDLLLDLLRARTGVLAEEDRELLRDRARVEINQATEVVAHLKKWRDLANRAPKILHWSLGISFVLSVGMLWLTYEDKVNGAELAGVLFVLGVLAISPVVLLLLQRPLQGMDAFAIGGGSGAGDKKDDGKKAGQGKADDGKEPADDDAAAAKQ